MFQTLAWALAGSICLHNLEEFVFLPRWRQLNGSALPAIETVPFRISALLITGLPCALAALTASHPDGPWIVILGGFGAVMALNAFAPHLALSFATLTYMPGTATGLALVTPSGMMLIACLLRSERAEIDELMVWSAVTGLGAACLVALIARTMRLRDSS